MKRPAVTEQPAIRWDECERCLGSGLYLHTVRGFGGIAVAFEVRRCGCLAGLLGQRGRL